MESIKILKHICLDKFFLIFLLIIILTGRFNNFFPYFALIFIHELGHMITGIVLGYQLDKITFYPYGGITTFNLPLNIPLFKELLILVMGPIFQIIGYLLLRNFFPFIKIYHYTLLIFNLLPIYPLDGGKIFNILFNYSLSYLKSFYFIFFISLTFTLFIFIYNLYHFNLNLLLMLIVIITKLIDTYKKRFYYYNRFLLERYLYHYSFAKIKYIKNINDFYRDRIHFINYQQEEKVLKEYFKNKY